MTREIPLTQGLIALVDDDDFEVISKWKWHAHKNCSTFYAERAAWNGSRATTVKMHREILPVQPGFTVDHVNGNGLDNRKDNLRPATAHGQNGNRRKVVGVSRFKGVSHGNRKAKPWQAQIWWQGKHRHIGDYATEEDAARAYDLAAKEEFGDFAVLNFTTTGQSK